LKNFPFKNKTILITGGAGSLGLTLAEELLKHNPQSVRLFDSDENGLFWAEQKLHSESLRVLLGDVRDRWRLRMAFDGVDIIYHTAALKHVHLSERNPFEALNTNAIGTQNCIESAIEKDVEKFVYISSDKAIEARGTYGVTKLLGEKLVLDAENYKGDHPTKFLVVRPANFWKSRGSVMELWEQQLKAGKSITVTHPEMTRYFMTIEDAVESILKATMLGVGGEIFIPTKVKKIKIMDMAQDITPEIAITGIRPGEKLHQELMTEEEQKRAVILNDFWVIK
jgi:UDP-N-acetylglucosamine 4,6-dehydratase/5-epimerase